VTFDLGILGGGQLARMTALAAHRSGLRCLALDPDPGCPAAQVASWQEGRLDDPSAIAEVLRQSGRVALENEFVPAEALERALGLAGAGPSVLVPGVGTLATIQDKLRQREALAACGVPQPGFGAAACAADVLAAGDRWPDGFVVKRRFGGYDGKGTRFVGPGGSAEAGEALERDGWFEGLGCLAEELVGFRRELAVMVVRDGGACVSFPPVETRQEAGVCSLVWTLEPDDEAGAQAVAVAESAAHAVGAAGLTGVELFDLGDGRVWVNELAPRPHNSGHYTLDWGGPSQFEAHVRSVLGLPLPPLEGGEAAMANLIGQEGAGPWRLALEAALQAEPSAYFHWYGKAEARPGRKMGHVNTAGPRAKERAEAARAAFYAAWRG
jgi:5-(carboxyamino)imidazole ribonucleotide synthase